MDDKLEELVSNAIDNGRSVGQAIREVRFHAKNEYHPRQIHAEYLRLKQEKALGGSVE